MRPDPAGVDDALGGALAVEPRELLDEVEVVEGDRAAFARGPAVLLLPTGWPPSSVIGLAFSAGFSAFAGAGGCWAIPAPATPKAAAVASKFLIMGDSREDQGSTPAVTRYADAGDSSKTISLSLR